MFKISYVNFVQSNTKLAHMLGMQLMSQYSELSIPKSVVSCCLYFHTFFILGQVHGRTSIVIATFPLAL